MIRHPRPATCPVRRRGARPAARIWLALLASAAIITGIVPAPAGAPGGMVPAVDAAVAVPYAAAGREQLAPGVYREIGSMTTVPTSPQAIHLVEVDPFVPVISFEAALSNDRVTGLERTSRIAARKSTEGHRAVAAVNAESRPSS